MESKKATCEYCGKECKDLRGLGLHQRQHCKEMPEEAKVSKPKAEKKAVVVPKAVTTSLEVWDSPDAFAEFKDFYEPGYRYRYVSEAHCDRRGWRGWEPVRISDLEAQTEAHKFKFGKSPDGYLRVGGEMILARMPEEKAKAREAFVERKTKQREAEAKHAMEQRIGRAAVTTEEYQSSVYKEMPPKEG
jgi:hypothetical protein